MIKIEKINTALKILALLDLPRAQQNERSALCLLALLNLMPEKEWHEAENPLIGITPIMEFCSTFYQKKYAPNTRETFRRQTIHQFVDAGIVLYNPDNPTRPVNSPKAVYQIAPDILGLIKTYDTLEWQSNLNTYLSNCQTLTEKYAKAHNLYKIPIVIALGKEICLSSGEHNELVKAIIEDFGPRFAPGGELVYVGDASNKWSYFNENLLKDLGITIDSHGKMPDVVIYYSKRNWLLLIESVTSHGPVDSKRHNELKTLFSQSSAGLVYVTAFPSRIVMTRYLSQIAWESEVWIADNPTHLIHFNGIRFLGPYE
jgi:hypothetical protein